MSKGRKRAANQEQRQRFQKQQQQQQDSNKLEGEREQEELDRQPAPTSKQEEAAALMKTSDFKEEHRLQCAAYGDNERAASVAKKQKMRANCCGSCLSTSSGQRRPIGGDEEEGDEAKLAKSRASPRVPSWLIVLMVLAFTIVAVVFAILAYELIRKEPNCPYSESPASSYQLFSTKTTYSIAYDYLSSQNVHPASSSAVRKRAIDQRSLGGELPNIFNKTHSLASLHRLLVDQHKCEPLQLHFFGRHASRYPKREEINKINQLINSIQSRIDLSKVEATTTTSPMNNTSNSTSTTNTVTAVPDNATNTVCLNPLTGYKQWRTFMQPDLGNSILDKGIDETRAMGERFKAIFPELFDQAKTDIEIGVTDSQRTSQTALIFMKLFDNFTFEGCDLQNSPDNKPDSETSNRIQQSPECYDKIEKLAQDKLKFHKNCRDIQDKSANQPISITRDVHIKDSNWNEFIVRSVTQKLKLTDKDALNAEETRALYDICRYESAFKGITSIWCSLFEDNELKFYEYRDDIDDFYNQAFGHQYQAESACPVTFPLLRAFEGANEQQKPSAHFYFTHSEVIQKILAASIDMSEDPAYDSQTIRNHLKAGTVPESRQWRTSLFTPFSANLAFTLYQCPKVKSMDGILQIDTHNKHLKVVASLNEQPIKLQSKKCNDFVCDMSDLMSRSRIFKSQEDCNLLKICKDKIIIT